MFNEGRVVYMGNIPMAEKAEIAEFLRNQDFDDFTFYWYEYGLVASSQWNHKGYCVAVFADQATAERAMNSLHHVRFKSQPIKTSPAVSAHLPKSVIKCNLSKSIYS
jgi:hypothetical protein